MKPECSIIISNKGTIWFMELQSDGKYKTIADSIAYNGVRSLYLKEEKKRIKAKDCTMRKLKGDPSYYVSKYFPSWVGKTIKIGEYGTPFVLEKSEIPEKKKSKKVSTSSLDSQFEIGDIFYTSWGYDQTNVSFFQVVSRTRKTVTVRKVAKEYVESTGKDSANVVPVKDEFLSKETKQCKINVQENKECYITNADGMGHNGIYHKPGESHYCSWGH